MAKRKKKMFRCPLCNFVSWQTRLEKSNYPLELVEVKSDGRGLIKHVFFDWNIKNSLHSMFERHFYELLDYLLRHKYINASAVKKLADIYVAERERTLFPVHIHTPVVVHQPDVIHHPKLVKSE